jgi:hypothetical protein
MAMPAARAARAVRCPLSRFDAPHPLALLRARRERPRGRGTAEGR